MPAEKSITVHCWLPELNGIALGIGGAGATLIGSLLGPLLFPIAWGLLLKIGFSLALLTFALAYCRVTVTPYEVRVVGSGLWKGRYRCPLEETAIGNQWLLPEWATQAAYHSPCLNFASADDWDTGIEFVEITFYNEPLLNCFRYQPLPDILAALRTIADYRRAAEQAPASTCAMNVFPWQRAIVKYLAKIQILSSVCPEFGLATARQLVRSGTLGP